MANLYEALVNKAGKQVDADASTASRRTRAAARSRWCRSRDEAELYYHDWVRGQHARRSSEATDGKVGYVHVPDMQQTGLNEFANHFYPQMRKKALIIDVRGNGGGNVSPMLIERLRREIAMIDHRPQQRAARRSRRDDQRPDGLPDERVLRVGRRPVPVPLPPATSSGKLIGKRSWGGVVGIRGTLPLLDGGTLNRPEFCATTSTARVDHRGPRRRSGHRRR